MTASAIRSSITAGDGRENAQTFDGPARAVRCATASRDAVRPLGIEIRAGVHTGECEIIAGCQRRW
jgi:class 3 adenylate cyclase